jgi:glycosyltransferase involved in cell wall biosynthesis
MTRLALIVSHPIQYYVPLYRRLARRGDLETRVFFTWHGGTAAQLDHGFGKSFAWDIPLTEGYEFEVVRNTARQPGTHHFRGLQNPELVRRVLGWRPDAVHVTGYAWYSHLQAIRALARAGVPVLFRGDSHLLDRRSAAWRWQLKRLVLRTVFSWPAAFLCVGQANKNYYRAFGVPESKLFDCPHSIETQRFAEPHALLEQQATAWRRELAIGDTQQVVLFAGKLEDKKRPLPLMQAFLEMDLTGVILLLVGDGLFDQKVRDLAALHPERFRVLSFQNQSKMPLVYRLGDVLVLPSAYGETWGLAVNEAMACGRPALVSDRVGCHQDVVRSGVNGEVFAVDDWRDFQDKLASLARIDWIPRRQEIQTWANNWSIEQTEEAVVKCLREVLV